MTPTAMVASQLVPLGTKSKALSNKQHPITVVMLIEWLQNGHLPYVSIVIIAKTNLA